MATIKLHTLIDDLIIVIVDARLEVKQAIEEAKDDAELDIAKRWSKALEAGYDWLVQQTTVKYDCDRWELTIASSRNASVLYHANGTCQCEAYLNDKKPCIHRGASRLIRRCIERQQRCQVRDQETFSAEYIAACYEEFEPVYLAGISGVARPLNTVRPVVFRRAAETSGIGDLFGD